MDDIHSVSEFVLSLMNDLGKLVKQKTRLAQTEFSEKRTPIHSDVITLVIWHR
jgi:hypothetical protein